MLVTTAVATKGSSTHVLGPVTSTFASDQDAMLEARVGIDRLMVSVLHPAISACLVSTVSARSRN